MCSSSVTCAGRTSPRRPCAAPSKRWPTCPAWLGPVSRSPEPATAAVNDGTRSLLSGVRWELAAAFDQFRGVDPTRKLVWDLRTVSQAIPSLKKGASALRNPSSLDFGEVRHEWLREVLMHWARTAHPTSKNLRRWHLSCVIASRALDLRPGGGNDPAKLQFSYVTAVVDAFKLARDKRGELYAPSHQRHLLAHFSTCWTSGVVRGRPMTSRRGLSATQDTTRSNRWTRTRTRSARPSQPW